MENKVYHGKKARQILRKGVNTLADAVAATLGPKGRNAALDEQYGSPVITNDGVSIARKINLEDAAQNIGCRIIKQAAEKVNGSGGDGTTTTTVIAQRLINNGFDKIDSFFFKADPLTIKRGLDNTLVTVKKYLADNSRKIETDKEIEDVATISAESRELGRLIADTINKVGKDGVITVETSPFSETTTDIVEGYQFFRGYMSPYMMTDPNTMEAVLNNPYILILDKKINEFQEIMPAIKASLERECKHILIIAPDASLEALATTVVNNSKTGMKMVIVKSPSLGNSKDVILQDIATITGGKVLSENNSINLSTINTVENFGRANKVVITKDSTTIIGGTGSIDDVQKRIDELNAEYNSNPEYTTNLAGLELKQRVGKLSGKVAIIKVGGNTEIEQTAIKLKIDDALCATKAAIEEGIVEGGGIILLRCANYLRSLGLKDIGAKLLIDSLEAPIRRICKNAGVNADVVIDTIDEYPPTRHIGLNALTMEYENFFEKGIIDPVKVTRLAVESAVSVSGILLTTESLVVDNKNKQEQ